MAVVEVGPGARFLAPRASSFFFLFQNFQTPNLPFSIER